MTTKNKIFILLATLAAFFAICGAFYASGYITGRNTQKSHCARKIAEINASHANHIVAADQAAQQMVISTTTAEKLQWLKDNRVAK